MSTDLIAGVIGLALGIAVVVLGLRRNLSEVTRGWLPRYGEASKAATVWPEFYEGGRRDRRLSPRRRKLGIWLYAFISLCNAAFAVHGAHDRGMHAANAAVFAIGAVVFTLRRPSPGNG